MKIYDLIIIGAGPAGITAGIYAARQKLDFCIITEDIGGQTLWSSNVENYTGYRVLTGTELVNKFQEHLNSYGIEVKENKTILSVKKENEIFEVFTKDETYYTKTVIAASGKRSKELNVPGEVEYKNKGVYYCATCDGPLFYDKDVAIIGGGNSALDAASQLVTIAKKLYIINSTEKIGGDEFLKDKVQKAENVIVYNNSNVKSIQGDVFVESIIFSHNNEQIKIDMQAVFIEIGLTPNSTFLDDVKKNNWGEIIVDEANKTNIPGLFAAGDVTIVPEKQIIIAAGEGSKAFLGAYKYLMRNNV